MAMSELFIWLFRNVAPVHYQVSEEGGRLDILNVGTVLSIVRTRGTTRMQCEATTQRPFRYRLHKLDHAH